MKQHRYPSEVGGNIYCGNVYSNIEDMINERIERAVKKIHLTNAILWAVMVGAVIILWCLAS